MVLWLRGVVAVKRLCGVITSPAPVPHTVRFTPPIGPCFSGQHPNWKASNDDA